MWVLCVKKRLCNRVGAPAGLISLMQTLLCHAVGSFPGEAEDIDSQVKQKTLVSQVKRKTLVEDVIAWFEGGDLVDRLGGPAAACAAATRGLLVAGGKSFTHTLVALERYQGLLHTLLERAGTEVRAAQGFLSFSRVARTRWWGVGMAPLYACAVDFVVRGGQGRCGLRPCGHCLMSCCVCLSHGVEIAISKPFLQPGSPVLAGGGRHDWRSSARVGDVPAAGRHGDRPPHGAAPGEWAHFLHRSQIVDLQQSSRVISTERLYWPLFMTTALRQALSKQTPLHRGLLRVLTVAAGTCDACHHLVSWRNSRLRCWSNRDTCHTEHAVVHVHAPRAVWNCQYAPFPMHHDPVQVTGAAIVDWAFRELRVKRFDEELGASLAWEALYAAVNKTIARTQVPARAGDSHAAVLLSCIKAAACCSCSVPATAEHQTSTSGHSCLGGDQ